MTNGVRQGSWPVCGVAVPRCSGAVPPKGTAESAKLPNFLNCLSGTSVAPERGIRRRQFSARRLESDVVCLHQDRGQRRRQLASLMPRLNDLYNQGRMKWTEQGKGWICRPEEVLGALATDGFYECHRETASPSGRRRTEGAWDGVKPQTRSVASVTWTVRRAPEPPMVFIEIDGDSITRPEPTPVGR